MLAKTSTKRGIKGLALNTHNFELLLQQVLGSVRGPGYQVWNAGLFKNTSLKDNMTLQLRVQTFNTFNHVNWQHVDMQLSDVIFEQLRQIAIPARWNWAQSLFSSCRANQEGRSPRGGRPCF